MSQVKFVQCTSTEYAGATKDAATLYFLNDTQQIYKGTVLYGAASPAVSSHTHGNINNSGQITSEKDDITSNDQILIADANASNAVKRAISFNTDNPSKFLREDGTWQTASIGINVDSGTTLPSSGNIGDIFVLYSE